MAELPNLAGVATKDLVDTIGSGRFQAAYINWARTINLLHEHAPGWMVDYVASPDGGLVHRAPVGGYLLIGFRHIDGTTTPALPQAVMDHKNNAIAYDKISARNITDTQRRGMCMAAAMTFGLTYELWAKDPMEEAYSRPVSEEAPVAAPKAPLAGTKATAPPAPAAAEAVKEFRGSAGAVKASEPLVPDTATEATFREAALEKGVHTVAIDALVAIVNDKLGGDFEKGLGVLGGKTADELNAKYAPKEADTTGEQW